MFWEPTSSPNTLMLPDGAGEKHTCQAPSPPTRRENKSLCLPSPWYTVYKNCSQPSCPSKNRSILCFAYKCSLTHTYKQAPPYQHTRTSTNKHLLLVFYSPKSLRVKAKNSARNSRCRSTHLTYIYIHFKHSFTYLCLKLCAPYIEISITFHICFSKQSCNYIRRAMCVCLCMHV